MKTTRLQYEHCLACGHAVDAATNFEADARPKPSDWTICINCGHLMAFDDELHLRELTTAERDEAAKDLRIGRMQAAQAELKRWRTQR
jgi:hypothetical protein